MIRRACWAATRFVSISPGLAIAFWMALFVISWNSARWKRADGRRGPEELLEVPADRLSLAVGVAREVDVVGGFRVPLQVGDRLLLAGKDLVRRLVAGVPVDRDSLSGEVPDVPVAGEDGEVLPEELPEGGRFRGGLDDDERLRHGAGYDATVVKPGPSSWRKGRPEGPRRAPPARGGRGRPTGGPRRARSRPQGVGVARLGRVEGEEDAGRVGIVGRPWRRPLVRQPARAKAAEVLVRELPEDVGRVADEDRSVLQEGVRPGGVLADHGAWNGRDVPARLGGAPRRDERAALQRRLDDDDDPGAAGDDPVADGKVPRPPASSPAAARRGAPLPRASAPGGVRARPGRRRRPRSRGRPRSPRLPRGPPRGRPRRRRGRSPRRR